MILIGKYPQVSCATCLGPLSAEGDTKCNRCWELERRLADYLRDGGRAARAFVQAALDADKSTGSGPVPPASHKGDPP